MRVALCALLLWLIGCKIQQQNSLPDEGLENLNHQTDASLLNNIMTKWNSLFGRPTPFCQAVLQNSPTRDDYIRNWQPSGDVTYCLPGANGVLESCQKKNDDAFEAGLLCYKSDL